MGYPTTTDELKDALIKNPHMKVLIASGYYDLATPYRAVEHTLAGLALDPSMRKNITIEKYESGHMMYVHGPSLHKLKRDGAASSIGRPRINPRSHESARGTDHTLHLEAPRSSTRKLENQPMRSFV